ncbi:MAG: FecR domain-containing protein [Gemmatimonadota bacterium]
MNDRPPDRDPRREWRTDREWDRLRARLTAPGFEAPRPQWPRRAAVLLPAAAAVLLAVLLVRRHEPRADTPVQRVVATAAGERTTIRLSDSTVVALGPATTIRYRITASRRDVELEGLANFRVVHDSARPFVVRARNAVATDIGTEFSVRAYAVDSAVHVSVLHGEVGLAGSGSSTGVRLIAGTAGHVDALGRAIRDEERSALAGTAWVDGRLLFENEILANVAIELSRWFDVTVDIPDPSLARKRITAVYTTPSLTGVLEALSATADARFEQRGRTITLRPRSRK